MIEIEILIWVRVSIDRNNGSRENQNLGFLLVKMLTEKSCDGFSLLKVKKINQ